MRTWITLFFCLLGLINGHSQSSSSDKKAENWIVEADSLNFIGAYQDALLLATQALNYYRKQYGKNDIRLAKAYKPMSISALRSWDIEHGIAYATRGVEILSLAEKQEIALTQQLNVLALCYYYLGNYQMASMYYDKISKLLYQKFHTYNHDQFIGTLANQGACYYQMQDFERAHELFQKSLDIILINHGLEDDRILGKYNNLGNVQLAKGNYHEALVLFKKSLAIKLKLLPAKHSFLATTCNNLGECYTKTGAFEKALHFYDRALQIYQNNGETCSAHYAESLCSIGLIYQKEKKYQRAKWQYEKALKTMQTCYQNEVPILATIYAHLANLSVELNAVPAALNYFEAALTTLAFDPENEKTYKNRNTGVRILEILENRISLFENIYQSSQQTSSLQKALVDCKNAMEIIDFLRIQYLENKAKLQLLDTYYPIFTKAINYCYQLHKSTGEEAWLREAFQFSEQSKSVVLLETLYKSNGILSTGIPDSLIEKEQNLRLGISFYEKQTYRLKVAGKKKEELTAFRNKTFDLKQSYAILMNKFEQEYPAYFQLKYRRKIVSIDNVQKELLAEKEALLEYFVGAADIFCFLITKEQIEIYKIKKDFPLGDWIEELRTNIVTYPRRLLEAKDHEAQNFAKLAFDLHHKLLAPLKLDAIDKLRIIPDGVLGYLPFEVLLTSYPPTLEKYRSYDFLLKKFALSYSFSASLLQQDLLNPTPPPQKNLIAFAPLFAADKEWSTQRAFGNLHFNTKEAQRIADLLEGEALLGREATETKFIEQARNYKIIHLATHAQTNDDENNYSYLAFSTPKDTMENELLHVKDLYNLKLNADMVVLSACETGLGKLQKGEGITSLARGFSYAGAKSIITTLWSVNDQKTADLMEQFYRNIKMGNDKAEALRQAQLNYIEQNRNEHSHPFFWAAFIPIGDMKPIVLTEHNGYLSLSIILFVSLTLLFGFQKYHARA
ncbi:MAG: CHAT domain-containing protein [Saprospiraceae bacterium]